MTSILGLTALGAFIYPLFRFLLPLENAARAQAITIPKSELPVNATKELMIGQTPSILINTRDKGFWPFPGSAPISAVW